MAIITSLFVLLLTMIPMETFAAGFDCTNAGTKLEKLICEDPELSTADDRLSLVFKQAVKKSNDKGALIKNQREWLKKRNAVSDSEALLKVYNDRVMELQDPVLVPIRSVASTCKDFLKRNDIDRVFKCEVSESGKVGSQGNKSYHYAIYCLVPAETGETVNLVPDPDMNCRSDSYHHSRGLSLYVQDGSSEKLKLLLDRGTDDIGLRSYTRPEIIRNRFGNFLYIPIRLDGTGNYNESDYYLWNDVTKGWSYLDSTKWLGDLQKYLPQGTAVGKGVWPDLDTMTAEVYLYRHNDPNCCPSGGRALVTLSVEKGGFKIKAVKIMKEVD